MEKLAEEGQPSMGGKLLVGGVSLERKDGLCHHFFISLVSGRKGVGTRILANQRGFFMPETIQSRILGLGNTLIIPLSR